MKVINASHEILTEITGNELKSIEEVARTCYKSIPKSYDDSKNFIRTLIQNKHEAMLEHSILSVKFICDRGISHELVRHRPASFAQESTRYCNYSKEKFGSELTFIRPWFFAEGSAEYELWRKQMESVEDLYMRFINNYAMPPERARCILPNSIKTEIVVTANYREWRHIFKLRAAGETGRPHPQMLEIMVPLLKEVKEKVPVIFDDITPLKVFGE